MGARRLHEVMSLSFLTVFTLDQVSGSARVRVTWLHLGVRALSRCVRHAVP